ncbi:MAG: EsaB/YukD family protein [Coriobacteriales bacterium]|jgi:hypothetical protein|nr:EsaB/YukD family protein [Coriobacteriales bacterium]
MNNRILINVLLPATQKTYDFWVPGDATVHDATRFISGILSQRESSLFQGGDEDALALRDSGEILDHNLSFEEHGIRNGFELMLI